MHTSDFYYDLPKELIAQTPIADRASSRLLVYNRTDGSIQDRVFSEITEFLTPKDVLVRNNTRVLPARLFGKREDTGGTMEFLLLKRVSDHEWECLCKPARRAVAGRCYKVNGELSIRVLGDTGAEGGKRVELLYDGIFEEVLDRAGQMPLPPYIHEPLKDPERYQTVYSRITGSAAAPTAGLHFTPELIAKLEQKGVGFARVTLHVGLDTFAPVTEDDPLEHKIHTEWCELTPETADLINSTRARGGRVIGVGTTSVRTLESAARRAAPGSLVAPYEGPTDIYILPGYTFRAVDAMITNFHLPKSTLIMMVSAFAGRESILATYAEAIRLEYRFYSFGDAMLII